MTHLIWVEVSKLMFLFLSSKSADVCSDDHSNSRSRVVFDTRSLVTKQTVPLLDCFALYVLRRDVEVIVRPKPIIRYTWID